MADKWVLVSKRRKRRPKGAGGPGSSSPPKVVVEKYLRFSNWSELYEFTDSGCDDHTFDNGISSQRIKPKVGRLLSDRELVERHYRHGPDTVRAHIRAVNWIYGVVDPDDFTNCPAHHIIHDGRRPVISPYEDQTNTDVEFTLEYDQSKSFKWNYYAEKWIAFWDDAYVSYWSARKGDVVTATHTQMASATSRNAHTDTTIAVMFQMHTPTSSAVPPSPAQSPSGFGTPGHLPICSPAAMRGATSGVHLILR